MAIDQIGLNFTALSNLTAPNISINTSASDLVAQIAQDANAVTGGWLGYIMLFAVFVLIYWILSDKSPIGDFKYSDLRALALASGITAIMGLIELSSGYIYSFRAVALFMLAHMVLSILLASNENKVAN